MISGGNLDNSGGGILYEFGNNADDDDDEAVDADEDFVLRVSIEYTDSSSVDADDSVNDVGVDLYDITLGLDDLDLNEYVVDKEVNDTEFLFTRFTVAMSVKSEVTFS